MREAVIQRQIIEYIEKLGFYVVKIIQCNKNGFPDLMVLIRGYRKGLGTGTAVDIPGGYAAAHFGGSSYRSGSELLQMVEGLDTAFARQIRTMVAEVENGLDRVFTVFSNEVVSMSTELNRAVGKTVSGKRASVDLARTELTTGAYAQTRDIELQSQES